MFRECLRLESLLYYLNVLNNQFPFFKDKEIQINLFLEKQVRLCVCST